MEEKKVLLVVGSLDVGGIEKLVTDYSACLCNTDYRFYYLVFGDEVGCHEKEVLKSGAKIIRIPRPDNRFSLYFSIRSVLKKDGPFYAVHSHILFSSGLVMKAAYAESVKVRIAHSHDNLSYVKTGIIEEVYHFLMRHYLRKYSSRFVACSNDAGKYLFGNAFAKMGGIVLKNRIDVEKYKYSEIERRKIRSKLGISDKQLLVGNIGRIEKQKNQKFIVDIMQTHGVMSRDAKAIIIGDGEEKDELLLYIKENKQDENILLLGQKGDVAKYLSAMDVFVFPSVHEGLGLVLIEAQANGLPCIATRNIVPKEAQVLDSFRFISQKSCNDPEVWGKEIAEAKRCNGEKSVNIVKEKGYDIDGLKDDLLRLYDGGRG